MLPDPVLVDRALSNPDRTASAVKLKELPAEYGYRLRFPLLREFLLVGISGDQNVWQVGASSLITWDGCMQITGAVKASRTRD
ncbi:MAG: hypothetical protein MK165_13960 [Pirellulaceae bacterium]|nr:hypothetical protein [Pirellulaceae bacterium]